MHATILSIVRRRCLAVEGAHSAQREQAPNGRPDLREASPQHLSGNTHIRRFPGSSRRLAAPAADSSERPKRICPRSGRMPLPRGASARLITVHTCAGKYRASTRRSRASGVVAVGQAGQCSRSRHTSCFGAQVLSLMNRRLHHRPTGFKFEGVRKQLAELICSCSAAPDAESTFARPPGSSMM